MDANLASRYRAAIAIAMYVSADRSDASFAIPTLSQRLSQPTVADYKAAQKLAAYMRSTEGYGILVAPNEVGASVLAMDGQGQPDKGHLLEACSDADWSGSHTTRRSMSGAVFYLNGGIFCHM